MGTDFFIPFLLTLLAGLSMCMGSVISFIANRESTRFLSFCLSLAAGVMIFVAFIELMSESREAMHAAYGSKTGDMVSYLCFFGGLLVVAVIDMLFPHHDIVQKEGMSTDCDGKHIDNKRLMRTGTFTALAIAIHNLPEGAATFMAALDDRSLGIAIAIAIAIHNIPLGIGISTPVYYASGSRIKSFVVTFLSGMAEPLGAIMAYLILMPFLNDLVMGAVLAVVAGVMVFIALDKLFPAAEEYGGHRISIGGIVTGMAVMAVSMVLLD